LIPTIELRQTFSMQVPRLQPGQWRWRIFEQQPGCSKAAGLLLVLLAVSFAGTGNAQASCGDYLANHNSAETMATGDLTQTNSRSDSEHPPVPCNGPSCNRTSELPATPATPLVVQNGGDQFGINSSDQHPLPLSCSERLSSDAPLLQQGFRQRIERPPRVLPTVL
jgi:hypothetical protein